MDHSKPGRPVHHQLPEMTQSWVGDAIQPFHPPSSPSPPAFNLSSISVFSKESALCIRWPKYWSLSFNISPYSEHLGLISLGWTGWISLHSKGLSRVFSNTTVQKLWLHTNHTATCFLYIYLTYMPLYNFIDWKIPLRLCSGWGQWLRHFAKPQRE